MNKSESKYFNTAVRFDKALISLLENKQFEYITVSEICKKAEVNRSTFYLHYENTADLLEETIKFLLDGFCEHFDVDTKKITDRFNNCSLEDLCFITDEYLYPYLNYVKDNARIFSTALEHAECFGFDAIFERMFVNVYNPILEKFRYPEADRKYIIMYYLNGINAILNVWIKEKCEKSVDDISRIIRSCIFGVERVRDEMNGQWIDFLQSGI